MNGSLPVPGLIIRRFRPTDGPAVADLFIRVNRHLAPDDMRSAFEDYIARSLSEEIGRIDAYYSEYGGTFHVATRNDILVGMYGLEEAGPDAMELRRMYVDPDRRRQGIAKALLAHAEAQVRQLGKTRMVLSTSEIQDAALRLYRSFGYVETEEVVARTQSNKALGGGLRRTCFEKVL